jgi:hypothetical protein
MKDFDKDKWIKDEKIVNMPRSLDKRKNLLLYVARKSFENREYTEKEVNEILKSYCLDFCMLRRYMIDFKILKRDDYGKRYRINEEIEF